MPDAGGFAPAARLLILTPDFPPAHGGIQLMSQRLATAIPSFQTFVVAPDAPGAREFDRTSALSVRRVTAPGGLRHGAVAALNAAALAQATRLRPSVTLSMHIVASPAAAVIRRTLGAHTVQYFHAEEITARPALAAFAATHADASVAVSAYTEGLIRELAPEVSTIRRIPPGVDLPDAAPEQAARGEPTIVTVARMEERYKGHDVMARALPLVRAQVPGARWVVIGEGSLRPAIEELVASFGLGADAALFLGSVSDEERARWLRTANVLAMPSRLPAGGYAGEGFGIVFLEAGAQGKPVLAGNVGGALDAVIDGHTGLLVDPTDPLAVADALVRLLCDRELAARLGSAGAQRAREFAWPRIAERVEALLIEQARA